MTTRVATPVIQDAPIGSNDESLRDRISTFHQSQRRLAVSPSKPKAEIKIAHKLLDAIRGCARVFDRQGVELYLAASVLLAHLLVFGGLRAARTTPCRPEIDN